MRTFKAHLQEKLEDSKFMGLFDEERELLRIGLEIAEARTKQGISQTELAKRANVTQQQVSKIENGINCNVLTLLRVCRVLSLTCRVNRAG
jgi:HTH-type transcriptional regulator / antitoxin HipB